MDSKKLASTTHKILKEMGHDMPLGHVYELLSKMSGHKDWNTCKTKGEFTPVVARLATTPEAVGSGNFKVKITSEVDDGRGNIELKKYYHVSASDEKEADHIVSSYIAYRSDEEESLLRIPGVAALVEAESEEDYRMKNWEVIWMSSEPSVQVGSTTNLRPHKPRTPSEKTFRISSLTHMAQVEIRSICGQLIQGYDNIPQKVFTAFEALNGGAKANPDGSLELTSRQLSGILDTVGGFFLSVHKLIDTGRKDDSDGSAAKQLKELLNVVLEARKEAEMQGYVYQEAKVPSNVFPLNKE